MHIRVHKTNKTKNNIIFSPLPTGLFYALINLFILITYFFTILKSTREN